MSKRQRSPEEAVVQFFMTADPDVALTLYRIARGILEQREVFARARIGKPRPAVRPRRTPPVEALPLTS